MPENWIQMVGGIYVFVDFEYGALEIRAGEIGLVALVGATLVEPFLDGARFVIDMALN